MIAILIMVIAGGGLAALVMAAMTIATRESEPAQQTTSMRAPQRDGVAASLLVHIVAAGGRSRDDATRAVRRATGIAAPITDGIDVSSWADSYARMSSAQERMSLLETAVQLIASKDKPVPLRQYAALLDLSFGLGFHTDALARLREVYGFDYVDHAKDARPRDADRAGGGAPLFVREPRRREEWLAVLGIGGDATRQEITTAYRKLVAQHHPDRFHTAAAEVQAEAARRFIEITRAYEALLTQQRD